MKVLIFLVILFNVCILPLIQCVPPLQSEEPKNYHHYEENEFNEEFIKEQNSKEIYPYYRLPSALVPTDYNIRIIPIMDDTPALGTRFTAPGIVTITVNCTHDTNVITLHKHLINITENSVTVKNKATGVLLTIEKQEYDQDTHFYNITTITTSPLQQGQFYEIYIEYIAPVSIDISNGLYRATYYVPGSPEPRYMAGTQLEPFRARQVFPCFDEPRWKAIHHVTIGRNSNYLSLSNGKMIDIKRHETLEDWYWDIFEPTVPMPTYLFSMAVADYAEAKADVGLFRTPVSVYAAPHLINAGRGDYSAEVSAKLMNFFETIYVEEYPESKVDSIVIPGKGGAMENWGLITYGNFLMYYDGETTETQRRSLVSIISHELAHQWFGNLVTCEWWSHIWLNEGFASYVSHIGMEPFYNEYLPRKWFVSTIQNALILDAGPSSHPIVSDNVNTIPEINSHFSSLQYDKGSSLIYMMEGFLGEETLNKGIKKYLKRMSNKVAVQDDLFQDLDEQALEDSALPDGKTIKDIMDTWTLQKGFPLVRLARAGSSRVYVSQERFINSGTNILDLDPNNLWEIPISIATKNAPNFEDHKPKLWLDKNVILTSISHDTSQWIMVNLESTGFYRVHYDVQLTNLIHDQLNDDFSVISSMSRSQLLDDYLILAFQDYISIESALRLTQYLAGETDFTVWNSVFTNLRTTFNLLSGTDAFDSFRKYFEPRIGNALKLIGVKQPPEEKGAVVILRNQLLDWACAMDNIDCINYASELLQEWNNAPGTNPYPIDVQAVFYCASVANGGPDAFEFFLNKYKAETSDVQKPRLLNALACAKENAILDQLLLLTKDSTSDLAPADSTTVRNRVAANSLGRTKAFTFVQNFLQEIIDYHSGQLPPISSFVTTLATYYGTKGEADNLRDFIEANSALLLPEKPALDNAMNTIERNIVWTSKYYQKMKTWFETQISSNIEHN